MPCDSVQSCTVDLSEVVKHPATMEAAIKAMGGRIMQQQPLIALVNGQRVTISGGELTLRDADEEETRAFAQQFTTAYGMAAAEQSADEEGWNWSRTSQNTFTVTRSRF